MASISRNQMKLQTMPGFAEVIITLLFGAAIMAIGTGTYNFILFVVTEVGIIYTLKVIGIIALFTLSALVVGHIAIVLIGSRLPSDPVAIKCTCGYRCLGVFLEWYHKRSCLKYIFYNKENNS